MTCIPKKDSVCSDSIQKWVYWWASNYASPGLTVLGSRRPGPPAPAQAGTRGAIIAVNLCLCAVPTLVPQCRVSVCERPHTPRTQDTWLMWGRTIQVVWGHAAHGHGPWRMCSAPARRARRPSNSKLGLGDLVYIVSNTLQGGVTCSVRVISKAMVRAAQASPDSVLVLVSLDVRSINTKLVTLMSH